MEKSPSPGSQEELFQSYLAFVNMYDIILVYMFAYLNTLLKIFEGTLHYFFIYRNAGFQLVLHNLNSASKFPIKKKIMQDLLRSMGHV